MKCSNLLLHSFSQTSEGKIRILTITHCSHCIVPIKVASAIHQCFWSLLGWFHRVTGRLVARSETGCPFVGETPETMELGISSQSVLYLWRHRGRRIYMDILERAPTRLELEVVTSAFHLMNIMFFPGFGLEFLVPHNWNCQYRMSSKVAVRLPVFAISTWAFTYFKCMGNDKITEHFWQHGLYTMNYTWLWWITCFLRPFSRVPIFLLVCWVFLLDSMFVPGVFRFVGNAFSSSTAWCCQVSPRNATPKRTRYVTSTIHKKLTFFQTDIICI